MKKFFLSVLTLFVFLQCNGFAWAVAQSGVNINSGMIIPVSFTTTINSDKYYNGDVIPITVTEDVYVDNTKVFSRNSSGTAEISKIVRSGSHGRAGVIEIRDAYIKDVFGQKHQIQLNAYAKGQSRRASAITLSVIGVCLIFIPFGIWREGDPAYLNGHHIYNAVLIN